MAIRTQYGFEVEIIGYDGMDVGYDSFDEEFTDEWVLIRYLNDGKEREMAVSRLRADGGFDEIDAAIAPFRPAESNS